MAGRGCDDWYWWSQSEDGLPNTYREFSKLDPHGQAALLDQMDAFMRGELLRPMSKLAKGVLELRANVGKNQYRILFMMEGRIAVVLTAFAKKDQRLSKRDEEKAQRRARTGHHLPWDG